MQGQENTLGAVLVRDNIITQTQLNHALQIQKEQEERERLGDILTDLGYVTRRQLREAVKRYGKHTLLGELLVESGVVLPEQLEEALREQSATGKPLGRIFLERQMLQEDDLARALSQQLDIPLVVPQPNLVDMNVFSRLPDRFIQANSVIPLFENNGIVTVVVADPTDEQLILRLKDAIGEDLELALCSRSRIDSVIEVLLLQKRLGVRAGARQGLEQEEVSRRPRLQIEGDSIAEQYEGSRAATAFDYIVFNALKERASDIHIEPQRGRVRIRYRIDGVLVFRTDFPLSLAGPLVRRAKALANLDISESQQQQQGRILAHVDGEEVDLRVVVCRSVFGEAMTIRIFSKDTGLMDLEDLGMLPGLLSRYRELARRSAGLTFFVGPTGTGKTTSLYATLNYLNDGTRKIVTVEAPVEYAMSGTVQNNLSTLDPASITQALQGTLHQDPDVIALGEISGDEAAAALLECAQMGHNVFATLHAEDAASALVRLQNVSEASSFLASSSMVLVGQRLVRKVCTSCSEVYVPHQEAIQRFQIRDFDPDTVDFRHGTGCAECAGTGFRGRTGIFEMLVVGPEMREIVAGRPAAREIREVIARKLAVLSMKQAGFLKAIQGVTTLEEALRVIPSFELEGAEPGKESLGELLSKAGLTGKESTQGDANDLAWAQPQEESR